MTKNSVHDNHVQQKNIFTDFLAWFGSTRPGAWTIINLGTRVDRWLIRQTDGRYNSTLAWPCLLLTTKGAKSGQPRTAALAYVEDGNNIVIMASNGGNLHHPSWYINLKANPEVQVFIDGKEFSYEATEVDGDEYDRLWEKAVQMYSGYAVYKNRTGDRKIPVVVLTPK